jgi:hypothetical protein
MDVLAADRSAFLVLEYHLGDATSLNAETKSYRPQDCFAGNPARQDDSTARSDSLAALSPTDLSRKSRDRPTAGLDALSQADVSLHNSEHPLPGCSTPCAPARDAISVNIQENEAVWIDPKKGLMQAPFLDMEDRILQCLTWNRCLDEVD